MSTPVPPRVVNYAPHIRLSAIGRLSDSGERFQYGVNLGSTGPVTVPLTLGLPAYYNDLAADVRAFHGSLGANISNQAVLELVKFALIGSNGKYTADPRIVDVADQAGSVSSVLPPPQTALAVSLTSGRRGPGGKGRFYLPMPGVGVVAGPLTIDTVSRNQIQAAAATFLTALNNRPGIDGVDVEVIIASTKGYNTKVTGVRVGRVLDTIRSRRTSLSEDFTAPTAVS